MAKMLAVILQCPNVVSFQFQSWLSHNDLWIGVEKKLFPNDANDLIGLQLVVVVVLLLHQTERFL